MSSKGAGEGAALELVAFRSGSSDFAYEARFVDSLLPAAIGSPAKLTLAGSRGSVEVESPVELVGISAKDIHPLPAAIASRCAIRGLRAIARQGESFLLVLDPRLP